MCLGEQKSKILRVKTEKSGTKKGDEDLTAELETKKVKVKSVSWIIFWITLIIKVLAWARSKEGGCVRAGGV